MFWLPAACMDKDVTKRLLRDAGAEHCAIYYP